MANNNQLIPIDEYGLFADKNDTARVDSRYVAKCFEKEHKNVIRDIRELDCSEEFRLLNFEPSFYKNQQGKKQPCYCMTRDGFVFLVMGYRGKKAAHFKEMYIRRFNEMEEHIKSLVSARQEFPLLTDSIKLAYDNPKPYHYSNECDMINRIVLGMTSKQYKIAHDIPSNESIRPYLSEGQIKLMDILQKVDIGLLFSIPDYHKRKQFLESYVVRTNRSLITA